MVNVELHGFIFLTTASGVQLYVRTLYYLKPNEDIEKSEEL